MWFRQEGYYILMVVFFLLFWGGGGVVTSEAKGSFQKSKIMNLKQI